MKTFLKNLAIVSLLGLLIAPYSGRAAGLPVSQTNVYLNAGQNTTVTVYSPDGHLANIVSISDTYVAFANATNNVITIYGLAAGTSQIELRTHDNYTATIYVTVTDTSPPANLTFSQSNVNMNVGDSQTISVYNAQSSIYIANNSNAAVVDARINNYQVTLRALAVGTASITVRSNTNQSGIITVSVSNPYNLYFTAANPTSGVTGQYYSYQFRATGGTTPYNFNLAGGILPAGLTLSGNGLLSGVPTNAGNYWFSIRVWDSGGRTAITNNLYVNISGQIAGATTYNNGTLINEFGTISIVYKNIKSGFSNLSAFLGMGYKLTNVINVYTPSLANSGYVISTAQAPHPFGSWILQGQTVYFVHEMGLIPITDYAVFVANGGADMLLVPANYYDFSRPLLDTMVRNDPRLK